MDAFDYKEILKMAINNEVEAFEFYLGTSLKSQSVTLKTTFLELAEEEKNHKRILEGFLHDDSIQMNFKESKADYKVSESTPLPPLTSDMSFADGIALAMKKEEEAMEMYRKFADASEEPGQKNTFLQLSKMEQGHKVRLEHIFTNAAHIEEW